MKFRYFTKKSFIGKAVVYQGGVTVMNDNITLYSELSPIKRLSIQDAQFDAKRIV